MDPKRVTQVTQVALSLGVTSLLTHTAMRCMGFLSRASHHELVARHPTVVAAHPALCTELGQLANLEQGDRFEELMRILEAIVALERDGARGNEFKISRAASRFVVKMNELVDATESWRSDELFNEKRIAREDTLPTVERQVENILHNFIIDRR